MYSVINVSEHEITLDVYSRNMLRTMTFSPGERIDGLNSFAVASFKALARRGFVKIEKMIAESVWKKEGF